MAVKWGPEDVLKEFKQAMEEMPDQERSGLLSTMWQRVRGNQNQQPGTVLENNNWQTS